MEIGEDEFRKMSTREQNVILYKNTNAIIRGQAESRFRLKVISVIVSIIGATLVWLGKLVIEHIGHSGG